uniref:Centromere protein T n=1 Tax=Calidris pygmaea TaxID=425635 RepID=A0A8C3KQK4_9CHAR
MDNGARLRADGGRPVRAGGCDGQGPLRRGQEGPGRERRGAAGLGPILSPLCPGTSPRAAEAPRSGAPRRAGPRQPSEAVALAGAGAGGVEQKGAGRTTLLKQRPTALPDLDNETPRVMLKRIIRTQPQVSPLAPRISTHEETEEARSELPSRRVSSMGEMQLPDLVPENTSIAAFHMTKKRKKLSISEFERAADKRLPQNQGKFGKSSLPSSFYRSLRISLGSLIPPDTVEKRGLLRRPKYRKAIDMEAFEGGVEQNMLKRKAQDYLVDSQTASGIQTALLASDAEIMLSNTELFVQPQLDEQSQNKLSALEPQLSDSKTSAQRSKISAPEEARLAGLVSSVGTNKGRTQRYSKDFILDCEHIDRMSPVSPEPPANQQEEKQRHSQQSNPMEQLSGSEEVVVGTPEHHANSGYSEHLEKKLSKKAELEISAAEDARAEAEMAPSAEEGIAEGGVEHQGSPDAGVEAGSVGRRSHAFSSEKSGLKPLEEAVEQADDQADELEDQAITIELDGPEEEPTEDEAEDPESEGKKTIAAAAEVFAVSQRSPLQAKPVPKSSGASRRKTREPAVASSLIKKIFSHYVKMPVARDAFKIVEKCSERYFKQLSSDLEAYTTHAGRKTVEMADLEVLMRRQGLVTDKMPLRVLIERYLPLEYRKVLIPVAVSGNKVIPCK